MRALYSGWRNDGGLKQKKRRVKVQVGYQWCEGRSICQSRDRQMGEKQEKKKKEMMNLNF